MNRREKPRAPAGAARAGRGSSFPRRLAPLALGLSLAATPSFADPPSVGPLDDLDVALSYFLPGGPARARLLGDAERLIGAGAAAIAPLARADSSAVDAVLRRFILENLEAKMEMGAGGPGRFPLSAAEILGTVVRYEIFKMRTYITSGVFPKRYFGYVDRKWDTAAEEEILLALTHDAVEAINRYQAGRGAPVRLSDREVLATYLAEGGALFYREKLDRIRPAEKRSIDLFYDLGCDNIGLAIARYPSLVDALDERFGTRLLGSGGAEGKNEIGEAWHGIGHLVNYRESIVASAVMYLFEKENARKRLRKRVEKDGPGAGWPSAELTDYGAAEQFVIASLVFNTGFVFPRRWVEEIRDFGAIGHLHAVSQRNASQRPLLPVDASRDAAFARLRDRGYPEQPTSWQGAYHLLQRYGAYVALTEYTDLFDAEGNRKER